MYIYAIELCKSNSFIKLTFSLRVVQDVWGISQNDLLARVS